jgi:1,4-dihydroxy-2-naphthoate octaprenyltransferase
MVTEEVSRREAWLLATRPYSLPAGAAPVIAGIGLALADGVFAPLPALGALLGALLIQLGTNLANDYFDAQHGVDVPEQEGFPRATARGYLDPDRVRLAMAGSFALAVGVGLALVAVGGVPILVVGLASILAGLLYTGGPYPYGYYGLGDLFVFVFFGLVAVTGTYYVQAVTALDVGLVPTELHVSAVAPAALVVGAAVGALTTNILVVNNIRDRETDRQTGKRTLAVLVGYRWSRVEYVVNLTLAYAVLPVLWLGLGYTPAVLLGFLSLPLAGATAPVVLGRTDGDALNPALERTVKLLAAFAVLLGAGLAVGAA